LSSNMVHPLFQFQRVYWAGSNPLQYTLRRESDWL